MVGLPRLISKLGVVFNLNNNATDSTRMSKIEVADRREQNILVDLHRCMIDVRCDLQSKCYQYNRSNI